MDKNIIWNPDMMLEIVLKKEDSFLIAMETLERIGMTSFNKETGEKTIYQSCHILHKQGKYYLMHFREMYALDGKQTEIPEIDLKRRNAIAEALKKWGLIEIIHEDVVLKEENKSMDRIRIISHKEKRNWKTKTMYKMGVK